MSKMEIYAKWKRSKHFTLALTIRGFFFKTKQKQFLSNRSRYLRSLMYFLFPYSMQISK